jgi:hypothetical protein
MPFGFVSTRLLLCLLYLSIAAAEFEIAFAFIMRIRIYHTPQCLIYAHFFM